MKIQCYIWGPVWCCPALGVSRSQAKNIIGPFSESISCPLALRIHVHLFIVTDIATQ